MSTHYYCDEHEDIGRALYDRYLSPGKHEDGSAEDRYGHDCFDAIVIAKKVVSSKLKSPSSAEFCESSDYTIFCSNDTWTVSGWVDAQKSFGAALRNSFTVVFTFTGEREYIIDSCDIG